MGFSAQRARLLLIGLVQKTAIDPCAAKPMLVAAAGQAAMARVKRHSRVEVATKLAQANDLARQGKLQSEIARTLGVSAPARPGLSFSPGHRNSQAAPVPIRTLLRVN